MADVEIVGNGQYPDKVEYLKPRTLFHDGFITLQANTIR
jgi:hypothetical protein